MSTSFTGRVLRIDALGVLAVVGISAAGYFLAVAPVVNAQARIDLKRQLLDQQVRRAEDLESRIGRARTELSRLKDRLAETSVPLFPASDLNKRLDEIARMCESHELAVQSVDPGAPTPISAGDAGGRFTAVPIKLGGTGGFADVSAFLNQLLARTYPDVEVRTLVLSNQPTEDPAHSPASFLLELRWYAAPEGSAAAASPESR